MTALPVSYGLPGLKTCRMPFPVQKEPLQYHRIGKHGMLETDRAEFDEASGGIGIFDEEEWRDEP